MILAAISLIGLKANYLVFHLLVEFMSILIAFMAVIVAVSSRGFTRNYYLDFIAIVIGWCAGIDLLHTMAYKGMDLIVHDNGNVGIQLWLVARYLQAIGFLIAPVFLIRPLNLWRANLALAGFVSIGLWLIVSGLFPLTLAPETGLTPFKIRSEEMIIGVFLLSLLHLYLRRSLRALLTPKVASRMSTRKVLHAWLSIWVCGSDYLQRHAPGWRLPAYCMIWVSCVFPMKYSINQAPWMGMSAT